MRARARGVRTFLVPLLLALVSGIGLLSALLGDGLWDALSWMALGTPIAVIIWHIARSRRRT